VTSAGDLESFQNRADDATGAALAQQSDGVLVAKGVASTFWVIARLVMGRARSSVSNATRNLRLVLQGLIASAAPAKPRMLLQLRRKRLNSGAQTLVFAKTQDRLQRECPSSNATELS
jgi:hypothetical protein